MQVVAYPCLVMTAITGFVGLFFILAYFRERSAIVYLPFALLCLSVALYDVFSIGLYNAHSVAEGMSYQKLQLDMMVLIGIFLTWFVALRVHRARSRVILAMLAWFAMLMVIFQFAGPDLTVSALHPSIKHISIGGVISVIYYEAELGIVYEVGIASSLIVYLYLIFLLIRNQLASGARSSLVVLAGLCTYFIGIVNDSLVSSRVYQFIYLSEYCFMLVVLSMFFVLLSDLANLYRAVGEANTSLEARVEERTREISKLNEELRHKAELDSLMAAMIASSKDAIIGVGLDDRVTSWNKGAEKIFGYTAEEMMGKPITTLLSPAADEQEPSQQEKLTQQGAVRQLETLVLTKGGAGVYVSTTFSPIQDANGLIVGITSISRDVTDQRALQAQIIRSQRLESLQTLASGIAHQFNNINTAAMAYLEIVARDATLAPTLKARIETALSAVRRAVEITERLQGLTGATSADGDSISLEAEVPLLLPLLEEKLTAEGISVQIDLQKTSPVRMSRATLGYIFTSLLSNSIHALLDCTSRTISLRTLSKGEFCCLEVCDTGCGIPPENLSRIFTPFFTTKGEWAEKGSAQARVKGTGLSLSVCQSAVSGAGGWIEVESVSQQGSTFRVWLPAAASAQNPTSLPASLT